MSIYCTAPFWSIDDGNAALEYAMLRWNSYFVADPDDSDNRFQAICADTARLGERPAHELQVGVLVGNVEDMLEIAMRCAGTSHTIFAPRQ